jgi:hypothetical protein
MEDNFNEKENYGSRTRTGKVFRIIGMVFAGVAFAVVFAFVFGFLVKWLWNGLMPDLFGLREITYWQAFGMVILAKLLFGTFGADHHKYRDRPPRRFLKWHDRYNHYDEEPWNRRSRHWNQYREYWQTEGKAAFQEYMKGREEQGEGG